MISFHFYLKKIKKQKICDKKALLFLKINKFINRYNTSSVNLKSIYLK